MPGALWYPKADRHTQDFSERYPGDLMPHTNVLLLHSTEGADWPGYDNLGPAGSSAPNATYKAATRQWRQHFPANRSSRALVNQPGGVETNTLNVFQVEIIGTCDPSQRGHIAPFVPELPDVCLHDIADLLVWLHSEWAVPLDALPAARWRPYPSSYGTSNGTRMSFAAWDEFCGVCGHQHAPENVHGDPGNIAIDKILAFARAGSGAPERPKFPLVADFEQKLGPALSIANELATAHPKWEWTKTAAAALADAKRIAHNTNDEA